MKLHKRREKSSISSENAEQYIIRFMDEATLLTADELKTWKSLAIKKRKEEKMSRIKSKQPKYKDAHGNLIKYGDILKSDGSVFEIDKTEDYMVLFFLGSDGIPFTTLRKFNADNAHYYYEVGQEFRIEV